MNTVIGLLCGGAVALSVVALTSDDTASSPPLDAELRVIAEGRFEEAAQEMFETYRDLIEEETSVEVPFLEGPEPCVGINSEQLRNICVDGLKSDDP